MAGGVYSSGENGWYCQMAMPRQVKSKAKISVLTNQVL